MALFSESSTQVTTGNGITASKMSKFGIFLVCILSQLDLMWRFTE